MYAHYAVGVPSWKFSQREFQRLLDIVTYNAGQLTEALGTESLAIAHLRGRLWFPWFTPKGVCGETEDYHYLVNGLCGLAQAYPRQISLEESWHEVRFLLWESGFRTRTMLSSVYMVWKNWCSYLIRALSDIHTCFFKRVE